MLRSGDVIVTPAGEPKHWRHAEDIVGVALRLSPAYVDAVGAETSAGSTRCAEIRDDFGSRDTFIEERAVRLLRLLQSEDVASRIPSIRSRMSFRCTCCGHYSGASSAHKVPNLTLPPCKLRRAIDYIEENLSADVTLSDIAAAVSMSPGHFAHAFQRSMGLPPHRYVLIRRVEHAKWLLRGTDLPMARSRLRSAAQALAISRCRFRRATGTRPRDYRNGY